MSATGGPERDGPRGRLVLVSTPIGNLGDLSPRAAATLVGADLVAAEDTRRTRVLLDHIGARVPLTSVHDHNEDRRSGPLLDRVAAGETIVLVTDAGTPGVADPGYVLVRAALARDLAVEAVPGPSAALHALLLSGLPMDRFVFEGFLPRKAGARSRRLAELAEEPRTLIFYVSPHRVGEDLAALSAAFGARPAALARELTKLHEEVWHGTLPELAERAADGVRGEVTLVVEGAEPVAPSADPSELANQVAALVGSGTSKRDAISVIAATAGVPRRVVYQAVVDATTT